MELETVAANVESTAALADGVAQLIAAAAQLERAAAMIEARFSAGAGSSGGEVAKVVAAVESDSAARLAELELKLQAAEQKIAELRAQASGPVASGTQDAARLRGAPAREARSRHSRPGQRRSARRGAPGAEPRAADRGQIAVDARWNAGLESSFTPASGPRISAQNICAGCEAFLL